MINEEKFTQMALALPGTETTPHFNRTGFKITGRRMFATYLAENNTANVFLTPEEQRRVCKLDEDNIYPVPNKWGEKGATTFELDLVSPGVLTNALQSAYDEIMKVKQPKPAKRNRPKK